MKNKEFNCIHCESEDIDIYDIKYEVDADGITVWLYYTCNHCEDMGVLMYEGELKSNIKS